MRKQIEGSKAVAEAVAHSLEQDADVVLLLNRPDYYDEEDRPGEGDIIVAKHRNGPTATIPVVFQGAQARFGNLARNTSFD